MNLSACGRYTWDTLSRMAGAAAEKYAARYDIEMDDMREWFRMTPKKDWPSLIAYLEREAEA